MAIIKKICTNCNGNGWLVNEAVMNNPQLEQNDHINCTSCNGDGWVYINEEDDRES